MRRRRVWAISGALAAVACGGIVGCSLILDFDGAVTDAGPSGDDAGQDDSGPDLCGVSEPNNAQAEAATITPGTFDAAICPAGDKDFYAFSVDGTQDMTLEITFDNMGGFGDLELFLYADGGAEIARSTLFGNMETISFTEADGGRLAAGTYFAEVRAFNSQRENTYALMLDLGASLIDAGLPGDGGM